MRKETKKNIDDLMLFYENSIQNIEIDAQKLTQTGKRAYGGVVRSEKGSLLENITDSIIRIAWCSELEGDENRLEINKQKIKIPIKENYLIKLPKEINSHIKSNIDNYFYKLSVDKHVSIDDKFIIGIECKAYTENAMLKRILVDFMLLKTIEPDLNCFLVQFESMLCGDYSKLNDIEYGSAPSHTLMSYFDTVNLNIITLIEGERDVKRPINKYFKPISRSSIEKCIHLLVQIMKKFK